MQEIMTYDSSVLTTSMNKSNTEWIHYTTNQSYYRSYLERQIVASMFVVAGIVGFCGNSLVIIAVVLSRKLRTSTNAFVVNLAADDLLTCTLLPWTAVAILSENGWQLPKFICIFDGMGLVTCLGCSINTLACIAVNRLVLITKPRKTYDFIYTKRNIAAMIFSTWVIPVIISTIPLISDIGELGYDYQTSTCTWDSKNINAALYANIIGLTFYPIQLSTIVYCYLKIFWYIRKHTKQVGSCNEPTASTDDSAANQPSGANMPLSEVQKKRLLKRQIDVTKKPVLYCLRLCNLCHTVYWRNSITIEKGTSCVFCSSVDFQQLHQLLCVCNKTSRFQTGFQVHIQLQDFVLARESIFYPLSSLRRDVFHFYHVNIAPSTINAS